MRAKETKEVYFSGKLLGVFLSKTVYHLDYVGVQTRTNNTRPYNKVSELKEHLSLPVQFSLSRPLIITNGYTEEL